MRVRSLRVKIALSAGALMVVMLLLFAAFSAWSFYREQLDMESDDENVHATAKEIAEARDETGELILAYLLALPFAAALSALGAWWLAGRLTTPLVRLTEAAGQIDARNLDSRLPEPEGRDEILTLARTLNSLLDRLERSFQQSMRFSADASHELRTPLAIMRSQLEHAIEDQPMGGQTAVLVELLEENQRLSSIADKLLLLARADAGRLLPGRTAVDLGKLVEEVAGDYGIMAQDRSVTVEGEIEPAIWVQGDASLLRQLAFNLFDNALHYNVTGGWIRYRLAMSSSSAQFSISNSGPPIPAASRRKLFDRFFRVDESRDRDGGGAGLGLSLCREIAHAHGGSIALATTAATAENEFILLLPAVEATPKRPEHAR